MLTVRVPERTVDSLVAVEIVRSDPNAIITSPTNTLNSYDHLVQQRFGITILETKGVNDSDRIPVDLAQLWEYVHGHGPSDTVYVLPSRPPASSRRSPWVRRCNAGCCGRLGCRFCPRDARSWAGLDAWIQGLDLVDRMQPWFGHWAWCVLAVDLAASLGVTRAGPNGSTRSYKWDDATLEAIPNAQRFCHLFGPSAWQARAERRVRATELAEVTLAQLRRWSETPPDELERQPLVLLEPPSLS